MINAWHTFKEHARLHPCSYQNGEVPGRGCGKIRDLHGWHIVLSFNDTNDRWMLSFAWTGNTLEASDLNRAFCHHVAGCLGVPAGSAIDYRWPIAVAQGYDLNDPSWPDRVDLYINAQVPGRRAPLTCNRVFFTWLNE